MHHRPSTVPFHKQIRRCSPGYPSFGCRREAPGAPTPSARDQTYPLKDSTAHLHTTNDPSSLPTPFSLQVPDFFLTLSTRTLLDSFSPARVSSFLIPLSPCPTSSVGLDSRLASPHPSSSSSSSPRRIPYPAACGTPRQTASADQQPGLGLASIARTVDVTPRPLISTHSVSRRNHESRGLWPKTTTANSQNFGTKVGRLFGRVGRIPQAPPPADPRIATGRETTGANRKTAKAANSQYLLGPSFPFATHTAKRSKVHRVFHTCTAATNETHSPSRHRSAPALGSCFLGVLFWFLILGSWSLVLGGVSHSHCRASLSGTRGSAPDPDGQRGKDTRHPDRQISSADTQSSRHAARVLPPPVSCFFYFSNRRNLEFATQQRRV